MISPGNLMKRVGVGGQLVPFFKCVCVYFAVGGGGAGGDAPSLAGVAAKCAPVLCLMLAVLLTHPRWLRASHRAGLVVVCAGGRAAGVAGAAGGGHGGVRRGPLRVRERAGLAAARAPAGGPGLLRRGAVPHAAGGAARAGPAGAAVRRAAGDDGVARGGPGAGLGGGAGGRGGRGRVGEPRRCRRRAAVPALGRAARIQHVRRNPAVQAGVGDVDVLPGAAGAGSQRAARAPALLLLRHRLSRSQPCGRRTLTIPFKSAPRWWRLVCKCVLQVFLPQL